MPVLSRDDKTGIPVRQEKTVWIFLSPPVHSIKIENEDEHCLDTVFHSNACGWTDFRGKATMTLEFTKENGMIWQPVFTLPRNEKKLFASLSADGIAAYLPMRRITSVHPVVSKGKSYCYKREFHVPMFPGYLFARISPGLRSELKRNRSVIRILPVTDLEEEKLLDELNMIRELENVSEHQEFDITNGLVKGIRVQFTEGEFSGWEGFVLDAPGQDGFAYINVTCVNASVKIRYPAAWCRILEKIEP